MAFRWFLQYPVQWKLPDPSSLCYFRGRLGTDGFRQIFDSVVRVARERHVQRSFDRLIQIEGPGRDDLLASNGE